MKGPLSFAAALWLFAAAAMAGFLLESAESLWSLGYLQNRQGLLYGPFTPVYGAGAVTLALVTPALRGRSWPVVFAACVLAGTAVEYVWSWGQELLFDVVFWDYSHMALHLDGRVNPLFSLAWGLLGLVFLRVVYPRFLTLFHTAPRGGRSLVTWTLALVLAGSVTLSSAALLRQAQRQDAAAEAASGVAALLDSLYPDERLSTHFPAMRPAK